MRNRASELGAGLPPGADSDAIRSVAHEPILVTQPVLPPLEDLLPSLQEIWDSKVLTNGGPFHQRFETALTEYLGVEHISLFTNCTIGLVTALQALDIQGEVITSPYSFVATAHALLWNRITPKFVDIDPHTLNIDPERIEAAITASTTAIMAIHCYGHPCDVEAIERIAHKHGLKVIYDAAHAFGVRLPAGNLLKHGDLSVLSFHATKVFNTFEGGAIVSPDAQTKLYVDQLKNFGFVDDVTVVTPGINGKMSEFNAALGLLQLKDVDRAIDRRREIDRRYRDMLGAVEGIECVGFSGEALANHAYFPILVRPGYPMTRDALYHALRDNGVLVRRYFYPLISSFPMYSQLASSREENLPVATEAAAQVICLPIHPALRDDQVERVVSLIASARRRP
ncbi:DegT/DnrJ/EryC1/StrS family aminotransferase [Variovorax sp. Root411]|uniref:DegT/DnrJ/EryC1/StrS family aminotransferase n=1 Tax=Variovorax sp. Root411 TaxID=1736530 RepID=UPI0009EAA430|nr:DegT/DnrJ/EryC1/StrS family aminotransferase [Variovorax sp. Root411]